MIDFELKLPPAKKKKGFSQKDFENWIATRPSYKESNGAWSRFVKTMTEARKKDEAAAAKAKEKPRMETTLERIDRVNYEYGNSKKRPHHLDNKKIETWEKSIADQEIFKNNINNRVAKKATPPVRTASVWSSIKNSSIYKLLDNEKLMGTELGHEALIELLHLAQNSGLLKKGGRVK
mgnify:CR=1 FL=1